MNVLENVVQSSAASLQTKGGEDCNSSTDSITRPLLHKDAFQRPLTVEAGAEEEQV